MTGVQTCALPISRGGNLILVTHGTNIAQWTGVHPAMGEMVILTPRGDGTFTVAGRLAPAG